VKIAVNMAANVQLACVVLTGKFGRVGKVRREEAVRDGERLPNQPSRSRAREFAASNSTRMEYDVRLASAFIASNWLVAPPQ
jgi:hypothetical protein